MDVAQKKCQVVVKKITLGERAMHGCVVPVKKLKVSDKTEHRVKLPKRVISPIQLHKLTVLLRKLSSRRLNKPSVAAEDVESSESGLSTVQLQKLRVLLHKLNVQETRSVGPGLEDRDKLRKLRVLLRKLSPDIDGTTGSSICSSSMGQGEETVLRAQLQNLKVLLKKLKLSKSESFIVDNGKVSKVQLQKFNILLRKIKLNQIRQDKPQPDVDGGSATQTCSYPDLPHMHRRRFRVLIKRLKLKREVQEQLDHTIFIDDKLGFVVNPYLIPGFHRSRILNRTQVKVLKIGRRSRAGRCHVRIRKLQL